VRVLHVIDQLNTGGAERVCIDLANLSSEHGLTVGILILLHKSNLDSDINLNVHVYYLHRQSKFNIRKYFEVAVICREYDVVHIHMRHVYRYMAVVNLFTKMPVAMVLHDHFGDIRSRKEVPFLFKSLFKPNFYIGVSSELTNWAIQNLGIQKQQVFLLPNIVRASKSVFSQVDDAGDIVVVSNIRNTKNIGFAIQLAVALNLKLDIIGQVADPVYLNRLKEEVRALQAEALIRFVHDCYDVQSRLENYRLALHTASSETGPLVLIEYLAKGTTFLAFRTGEVAESLYQMLPELFMDNFDIDTWKNRLLQLLEKPIDKVILKTIFQNNFNEEKYLNKCLTIYQSIHLS
jgi:glycosyltransferase involved in cell wall biosynthesis